MILEEENTFLSVILDKSNDVIDFDIDHHISCSKQNLKILLENHAMIINTDEIKNIYVAKQFCDMRKQIDGLALIVTSQFNMNVLDHSLFIFTKERRKAPRFSHGDIRRSLCSCF